MIHGMRRELGFETVVTGYGLTEASGIATMCRRDDDPEIIAKTSGRAIDGVEVLVVDENGSETQAGEPGEVVIRGYNIMRGYLDDPERTHFFFSKARTYCRVIQARIMGSPCQRQKVNSVF